ncbi:S-adenosylmethionine-dependent methyltransferase [Ceratobasidium sp. 423]|nr:S-adenosylmethionine-dependent methyltransferase [Ceratobasidium sp. 423]
MIPTPDLSHLTKDDFMRVYEPAEDTFLLLDALEEDANHLRALKPGVCVEVQDASRPFSDGFLKMNPAVSLNAVICDLVQPFKSRLHGQIDVLIFNPPYVPTEEEEAMVAQSQGEIAGAWAGGFDGMAVTNRLLDELNGCFYLVALKQNDPQGIIARVKEQWSLDGKVILQRRAGREHLFILRFTRL